VRKASLVHEQQPTQQLRKVERGLRLWQCCSVPVEALQQVRPFNELPLQGIGSSSSMKGSLAVQMVSGFGSAAPAFTPPLLLGGFTQGGQSLAGAEYIKP
jgi:hypothetical protein